MLNDLLTLARIREGDIKAFEDVFRRYYSPLCWYAMSITGSMEAAEGKTQETTEPPRKNSKPAQAKEKEK